MPKPAKTSPNANGLDIEQVTQSSQKSLAAIAHLHSRVFRDALTFNAELLDFARRRIRADIEASDRLCRCDSMTDAMAVVNDFCQTAIQDYAEESTALMRIGAEISTRSAEETVAEAARVSTPAGG